MHDQPSPLCAKAPPRPNPKRRGSGLGLLRIARSRVDRRSCHAAALRRRHSAERTDRAQQPHAPEQADDQPHRRGGDREPRRRLRQRRAVALSLERHRGRRPAAARRLVRAGGLPQHQGAGVRARGGRVRRPDAADRDRESAARGHRARARDAERRTGAARRHARMRDPARRVERDVSGARRAAIAAARLRIYARRPRRVGAARAAVGGDRLARRARARSGRRVTPDAERPAGPADARSARRRRGAGHADRARRGGCG